MKAFLRKGTVGITSVDVPFLESTETLQGANYQFLVCFIYRLVAAYQPEIRLLVTFLKDNFERIGERAAMCIFSENIVGACISV